MNTFCKAKTKSLSYPGVTMIAASTHRKHLLGALFFILSWFLVSCGGSDSGLSNSSGKLATSFQHTLMNFRIDSGFDGVQIYSVDPVAFTAGSNPQHIFKVGFVNFGLPNRGLRFGGIQIDISNSYDDWSFCPGTGNDSSKVVGQYTVTIIEVVCTDYHPVQPKIRINYPQYKQRPQDRITRIIPINISSFATVLDSGAYLGNPTNGGNTFTKTMHIWGKNLGDASYYVWVAPNLSDVTTALAAPSRRPAHQCVRNYSLTSGLSAAGLGYPDIPMQPLDTPIGYDGLITVDCDIPLDQYAYTLSVTQKQNLSDTVRGPDSNEALQTYILYKVNLDRVNPNVIISDYESQDQIKNYNLNVFGSGFPSSDPVSAPSIYRTTYGSPGNIHYVLSDSTGGTSIGCMSYASNNPNNFSLHCSAKSSEVLEKVFIYSGVGFLKVFNLYPVRIDKVFPRLVVTGQDTTFAISGANLQNINKPNVKIQLGQSDCSVLTPTTDATAASASVLCPGLTVDASAPVSFKISQEGSTLYEKSIDHITLSANLVDKKNYYLANNADVTAADSTATVQIKLLFSEFNVSLKERYQFRYTLAGRTCSATYGSPKDTTSGTLVSLLCPEPSRGPAIVMMELVSGTDSVQLASTGLVFYSLFNFKNLYTFTTNPRVNIVATSYYLPYNASGVRFKIADTTCDFVVTARRGPNTPIEALNDSINIGCAVPTLAGNYPLMMYDLHDVTQGASNGVATVHVAFLRGVSPSVKFVQSIATSDVTFSLIGDNISNANLALSLNESTTNTNCTRLTGGGANWRCPGMNLPKEYSLVLKYTDATYSMNLPVHVVRLNNTIQPGYGFLPMAATTYKLYGASLTQTYSVYDGQAPSSNLIVNKNLTDLIHLDRTVSLVSKQIDASSVCANIGFNVDSGSYDFTCTAAKSDATSLVFSLAAQPPFATYSPSSPPSQIPLAVVDSISRADSLAGAPIPLVLTGKNFPILNTSAFIADQPCSAMVPADRTSMSIKCPAISTVTGQTVVIKYSHESVYSLPMNIYSIGAIDRSAILTDDAGSAFSFSSLNTKGRLFTAKLANNNCNVVSSAPSFSPLNVTCDNVPQTPGVYSLTLFTRDGTADTAVSTNQITVIKTPTINEVGRRISGSNTLINLRGSDFDTNLMSIYADETQCPTISLSAGKDNWNAECGNKHPPFDVTIRINAN